MISKELLDIMVCPLCKSELKLVNKSDDVIKEWLICQKPECGCQYRIENDIPIMLIDQARRPCPKCNSDRDWDEEKDTLHCLKCNTDFRVSK